MKGSTGPSPAPCPSALSPLSVPATPGDTIVPWASSSASSPGSPGSPGGWLISRTPSDGAADTRATSRPPSCRGRRRAGSACRCRAQRGGSGRGAQTQARRGTRVPPRGDDARRPGRPSAAGWRRASFRRPASEAGGFGPPGAERDLEAIARRPTILRPTPPPGSRSGARASTPARSRRSRRWRRTARRPRTGKRCRRTARETPEGARAERRPPPAARRRARARAPPARVRPPRADGGLAGARAGERRRGAQGLPHAWLSILEPPVRGGIRLPRLPFEVLFLAGCAAGAGVAELEPRWIAAVMAGAWLLVSLTEWSATRADRRRAERSTIAPPQLVPARPGRPDAAWYIPPVEQTMMEGATRLRRPARRRP